MTIIQSVILGIIEGVTEFLPVSSTGHLVLASSVLGINQDNFVKSFEIAIQAGAILAVVVLYWQKIVSSKDLWKKVLVAFVPTAIIGFLLYKVLKDFLLSNPMLIIWALAIGGAVLIVFELWYKKSRKIHDRELSGSNEISYKKSFFIGVWQALAIIPGVSRSGATIVGGMLMGLSREAIVEFSFLLAVPTIVAATAYDLFKSASDFSLSEFHLLAIGFIVSFIVAILAIKWFIGYIKNHSFIWFGVYRIIIAGLFWILLFR